jgi:DNA replication protein DnaC
MPKPWPERQDEDAALLASASLLAQRQAAAMNAAAPVAVVPPRHDLGERDASCERHGAYVSRGTRFCGRAEVWSGCAACVEDERRAEAERAAAAAAQALKAKLEESMRRSSLPERFVGQTFETYVAETPEQTKALGIVRSFAEDFDRHARAGSTLILSGKPGTGKSHLACAAIQAIAPKRFGMYVTTMGLIRMVRETWRKGSERTEADVLDDLARVDLLVIDEVGVQYGTEGEKVILFEILDQRYSYRKPSILLTNLGAPDFKLFIGDRIHDRLRETGRFVPFEWESYRAKARRGAAP